MKGKICKKLNLSSNVVTLSVLENVSGLVGVENIVSDLISYDDKPFPIGQK